MLNFTPGQQWVEITLLYLEGKTQAWYEEFLSGGEDFSSREEFAKRLCMRFDNKEDVVEEFNKLAQNKNMEEHVKKFKELKDLMNALNPLAYYILIFLSGLKDDIRSTLKILKPATLIPSL